MGRMKDYDIEQRQAPTRRAEMIDHVCETFGDQIGTVWEEGVPIPVQPKDLQADVLAVLYDEARRRNETGPGQTNPF